MALAALALALAAPAVRRHELHAAPPASRRLEVDYEGYKKLAMEGNAEALQQKFKHASPEEQLAIKNEILRMRAARRPAPASRARAHNTHRPAAQTTSTRRRSATRPSRCGRASTT